VAALKDLHGDRVNTLRHGIQYLQDTDTFKYSEVLSGLPHTKIIDKLQEPFLICWYLPYVKMYLLYLGS